MRLSIVTTRYTNEGLEFFSEGKEGKCNVALKANAAFDQVSTTLAISGSLFGIRFK